MVCVALHVVGVLVARPVWRGAEVLALVLLLAYAVVGGPPAGRWPTRTALVTPAALALLAADALRTMPPEPGSADIGWQVLRPDEVRVELTAGFDAGLTACWAMLGALAVLLLRWRGPVPPRWVVAAGAAAAPVVGYAVVRVVDIWRDLAPGDPAHAPDVDGAEPVSAVILAVVPSVALATLALTLAALLAGHGRLLAAAGAALLAVIALPLTDSSIGAVPLSGFAGEGTELFAWHAITPTSAMPQPVPALTVAVELTAYLLLVVGLRGADRGEPAAPSLLVGQAD
ncbi:hypothetical protein GA0070622_4822 [Micromonospora sediminicola]|uniref:Uncharacterized protein n=1 Tax=Micromonospora sediminicola TaxID=946078 RepID=A0A1A9BF02_9ACTN|nr:hypothetical protein GA0070622_4822 [Micromonospora sediminicola]